MKLIVKEGIYSRNSPKNTMDSILLTLKNDSIDGIYITVQITQDGVIVVCPDTNIIPKPINKIPYKELLKYNIGTKVKKHRILTLEEVLEKISTYSKMLVIELVTCDNNLLLIGALIKLTSEYPNVDVYLKTNEKEEMLYLQEIANNCKVGTTFFESNDFLENLDFYSIDYSKVNLDVILKSFNNRSIIMIENMNIIETSEQLKKSNDRIYLIVDNQQELIKIFNMI